MVVLSRKALTPGSRIRVLVVDDSDVTRRVLSDVLARDPCIHVVGGAHNGYAALERIPQVTPDLITLDVEMPEMDGIEALRRIRRLYPDVFVLMVSAQTARGALVTLDALSLGANDYVLKPQSNISAVESLVDLRSELPRKVKQFFTFPGDAALEQPKPVKGGKERKGPAARLQAVVIGVSTGGPTALGELIPQIPATFPAPILIVQHMPPMFTKLLAERLGAVSKLPVAEATDGMPVEPGRILIAPGNYHMAVKRASGQKQVIALNQDAQENSCRPAVDVLFRSAADLWGGGVVGVVLTGMGQDGFSGAKELRAKGSYIIAQDEASSVVWGMPGFVAREGIADAVLPLGDIGAELRRLAQGSLQ